MPVALHIQTDSVCETESVDSSALRGSIVVTAHATKAYYPGWRAFVDGHEAPLLRADCIFRAVPVPAGTHEVRLVFVPRTWQWGLAISLATFLALAAWALPRRWRGRTPTQ